MDRFTHKRLAPIAIAVIFLAAAPARADQVKLNVALGHPVLKADKKQTTYLKVGLTGFHLASDSERPPVNLVIVLDKSGSMQGDKIRKAKEAALMVIDRLSRRDIVSVVTYCDTVQVLVPATRLSDKYAVKQQIRQIQAGGSTALFAGVSKGAAEVRKFLERNKVNRVILLSDGLANVGPSSPYELGQLGASVAKEGISVTTIGLGLGYNEDLMSQLALKSDGNHYFAENAADLARVFDRELGDVLTVVAQKVVVRIVCAPGIRPVRGLGREVDITGQTITATLNQLYSDQEKYVLVEVEVPATAANQTRHIADVSVTYANMQTKTTDRLASALAARFTRSEDIVVRETNKDVVVNAVQQIATINNRKAVELRDKGQIQEAKQVLKLNTSFLRLNAVKFESEALKDYANVQELDAKGLTGPGWAKRRKEMRATQSQVERQQKR